MVINIDVDIGLIVASSLVALHMALKTLKEKDDALDKFKDFPIDLYEQIKTWANKHVEEKIEEIVDSYKESFSANLQEERINELRNGLVSSLRKLVDRLASGFNVDVRAGPPRAQKEGEQDTEGSPVVELEVIKRKLSQIREMSAQLHVLELQTTRILSLPEPAAEDAETADEDGDSVSADIEPKEPTQ